jgi:Gram-negative bacterial TonB protein C-terminal
MCNEGPACGLEPAFGKLHLSEIAKRKMNLRSIPTFWAVASRVKSRATVVSVLLSATLACAGVAAATSIDPAPIEPTKPGEPSAGRVAADRNGSLPTRDGLTLRLTTDLGSVKIVPLPPGAPPVVRYTVHIETDARAALAQRLLGRYSLTAEATDAGVEINGTLPPTARSSSTGTQFWVQFEIEVPRGYNIEVKTEAGDIETQDIGGTANLSTQGGNIRTGRIGVNNSREARAGHLAAKLATEGGHIQVLDVAGDLNAFTAGGHINAGNIAGDALLHSGGGHIRAEQINGRADLQTDGGNITVGQAGSLVSVRTGGGQIDFGEVRGSVRAQTGGGGIRIMYVSGPMEVESSAGSICLTRVAGSVRAATAGGSIRAWINPDKPSSGGTVHLAGVSQLTSGNGDIIVFLPRNLAADIDATVESGGERRIEADPALGLTMQPSRGPGTVHVAGALNGGGAPLKLRSTSGTIHLRFLDSEVALRDSLIRDQKERLSEHGVQLMPTGFDASESSQVQPASAPPDKGDWLDSWLDRLQIAFVGGVREDSDEFMKHLIVQPPAVYPEIAMRAGVQGLVKLQVRATRDGHIEVEKLIDGAPSLADAAIAAVKQWRINPTWVLSKRGDVISTVTFNFILH